MPLLSRLLAETGENELDTLFLQLPQSPLLKDQVIVLLLVIVKRTLFNRRAKPDLFQA